MAGSPQRRHRRINWFGIIFWLLIIIIIVCSILLISNSRSDKKDDDNAPPVEDTTQNDDTIRLYIREHARPICKEDAIGRLSAL